MFNPSPHLKCCPNSTVTPTNDVSDFTPTVYMEIANSGKTVKIYVFENGKRCFIGQVPCRNLRALLNGQSLKVDINKYRHICKVKQVTEQQNITFYCSICCSVVHKTYKDDTNTQFYNCPKCGVIPNTKITLTDPKQTDTKELKNNITSLQHINEIENPKYIGNPVTIHAVISSTSTAYTIPATITVIVKEEDQENAIITPTIPLDAPLNLSLAAVSEETQHSRLKKHLKTQQPNAEIFITKTLKHRTVYALRIRPQVITLEKIGEKLVDDKGYEYKHLDIYVVSDTQLNFQPSTLIELTGKPLPNPKTQKTTFLAYKTEFIEDNLNFDQNKVNALQTKFQNKSVKERLNWITNNFEQYSHVVSRQNITKAALLSYFTPVHISFNKQLQRGWGIITVVGDTTTGKSETVKKLSRLLKAGMVLSAETASTVGLTGTAQQTDRDGWFIDWGFLPLMDRKLLAVDGCHKLGASCWAALAEAERSGVLSISKAAKNQTYARTRQIKIYNPIDREADRYSTKSLVSFLHPIQSLKTILDPTSIARIDLCVFSDQRDVPAELINKKIVDAPEPELECLSECLKWAWSGKAKVKWMEAAVDLLLSKANVLYSMFFLEDIPLVSVDVKYKIARLSEALAYCTLSVNDGDFSVVVVTEEHVTVIVDFLIEEYTNAGLGILAQEQKFEKLTLKDVENLILKIHAQLSMCSIELDVLVKILEFTVKQNRTTLDELKAKFNLVDNKQARPLTAILKTEGLLSSKNGYYPTSKLIDAYKVTRGFTNLSGLSDLSTLEKTPLPLKHVNEEQKTISINTKETNFENIKAVKTPIPTTFTKNGKNELKHYFDTEVAEIKNAKSTTNYPKEETSKDYSQLVCVFCQRGIMENDWTQDDFTWNKPAHNACYEEKRSMLSTQDRWETDY